MDELEEIEPIESVDFDEFDDGTEIRLMSDGSIQLRLSMMPPSWAGAGGPFENFAAYLSSALNTNVSGLDKELYSIPKPATDPVETLKSVLRKLRHESGF